jgi:hypothetical protein
MIGYALCAERGGFTSKILRNWTEKSGEARLKSLHPSGTTLGPVAQPQQASPAP